MPQQNNEKAKLARVESDIGAYLAIKHGDHLSQADVAIVLQMTRGAVANLPETELPKHKSGSSRTSPVFYKREDVVKCMMTRMLNTKNKNQA